MAANNYTERALEDLIEAHLIEHGGWRKGDPADFDPELALITTDLFAFVQATQPDTWDKLRQHHQTGLKAAILDRLTRVLDSKGTLDVARHGFTFFGQQINLATFRPAHDLNPEIVEKYAQNRLVVTRQVKFNPKGDESIDMLLSLNGLPIATVELKNQLTGQNVDDAIKQYKRRNPKFKLFQFKRRALVHFAVGPERVAMTTHLWGKNTVFLPFNRGHDGGAGNPPHPRPRPSKPLDARAARTTSRDRFTCIRCARRSKRGLFSTCSRITRRIRHTTGWSRPSRTTRR